MGAISFAWGILCFFFLPSTPKDCKFFSKKEKMVAVYRVSHNRTGIRHKKILWYQAREAALDTKTYCFAFTGFCLGIINGGVSNFMSAMLEGFGYDAYKALMYQVSRAFPSPLKCGVLIRPRCLREQLSLWRRLPSDTSRRKCRTCSARRL